MTDEKFLQAVKIKDELDYLKTGIGFDHVHNNKQVAVTIEEVSIFSTKGHFKFYRKDQPELFEYVKTYIENMEIEKQNRIQELEKQFAEL
jgi:hypothetical protein